VCPHRDQNVLSRGRFDTDVFAFRRFDIVAGRAEFKDGSPSESSSRHRFVTFGGITPWYSLKHISYEALAASSASATAHRSRKHKPVALTGAAFQLT